MDQIEEIQRLLADLSGDDDIRIHDLGELGLMVSLPDVVELLRRMHQRSLDRAVDIAEAHALHYNPDGAGYEAGYKSASVDIGREILALEIDDVAPADPQ